MQNDSTGTNFDDHMIEIKKILKEAGFKVKIIEI
jgi:hypothetical protein